jgi:hypothetical protein
MAKSAATTNDFGVGVAQKVLCKLYEADVAHLGNLPLWRAAAMSAMGAASATVQ